jgi:hypothetical protein
MATSGNCANNRNSSRILGIPLGNDENPQGSLKADGNTTAWDIYNQHAGQVESEDLKDWKDTLNTILVFVSSCMLPKSITM